MKIHTVTRFIEGGQTFALCVDCGRVFDLLDKDQTGEYYYGHDCEV